MLSGESHVSTKSVFKKQENKDYIWHEDIFKLQTGMTESVVSKHE